MTKYGKHMKQANPKIDRLLNHAKKWQDEMKALRGIILESDMTEDLKWRLPCYMVDGHNVVIIQGFKEYCAVMFFKGALLKDAKKILETPGTSQVVRQIRFKNLSEVIKKKSIVKSYVKEAIKIEKAGLKAELKKTKDYKIPSEFQKKLDKMPKLKAAYETLTPGRQRAYLFYFSQAKQAKTREDRVEKCIEQILKGKGLRE